ncbi:hypothetical protein Dimus_014967 [Dionaea muscipula]
MFIAQHWGEVLMIDFGSVESGCLDDGRIKVLTDVMSPFFFAFKLLVVGKTFDYWVVEGVSTDLPMVQGCYDSAGAPGSGQPWEYHRSISLLPEVAMVDPLVIHGVQDLPQSSAASNGDKAGGVPDSSSEVLLSEVACNSDPDMSLHCDGDGIEEGRKGED